MSEQAISVVTRGCTALLGVVMIGLGVLYRLHSDQSFGVLLIALIVGTLGVYLIVAAIIPRKAVTDEVGGEVFSQIVLNFPLRVIEKLLSKLADIF